MKRVMNHQTSSLCLMRAPTVSRRHKEEIGIAGSSWNLPLFIHLYVFVSVMNCLSHLRESAHADVTTVQGAVEIWISICFYQDDPQHHAYLTTETKSGNTGGEAAGEGEGITHLWS